jgi:hypothetical protein
MTILTFPTDIPAPNQMDWTPQYNTQTFESPLTGSVQTLELPGMRWAATLNYNNFTEEYAASLEAFITQLRGQSGRFYLYNFARSVPRGTVSGSPTVNNESASPTALQTGTTLITKNWGAGSQMKKGDFFSVNYELKMMKADATADGSGNMTMTFEPPLRSSPAHGDAIVYTKPKCIMMLRDDKNVWRKTPGYFTDFTLDCIEAFR